MSRKKYYPNFCTYFAISRCQRTFTFYQIHSRSSRVFAEHWVSLISLRLIWRGQCQAQSDFVSLWKLFSALSLVAINSWIGFYHGCDQESFSVLFKHSETSSFLEKKEWSDSKYYQKGYGWSSKDIRRQRTCPPL